MADHPVGADGRRAGCRHDRCGRHDHAGVFLAFVEQVLLPELRQRPGCLVVMDNLAPHKAQPVRKAFNAAGVPYHYLPASSPDLSLIKQT